jgi:hypothetical protein
VTDDRKRGQGTRRTDIDIPSRCFVRICTEAGSTMLVRLEKWCSVQGVGLRTAAKRLHKRAVLAIAQAQFTCRPFLHSRRCEAFIVCDKVGPSRLLACQRFAPFGGMAVSGGSATAAAARETTSRAQGITGCDSDADKIAMQISPGRVPVAYVPDPNSTVGGKDDGKSNGDRCGGIVC